jgi:hypothetical protein
MATMGDTQGVASIPMVRAVWVQRSRNIVQKGESKKKELMVMCDGHVTDAMRST